MLLLSHSSNVVTFATACVGDLLTSLVKPLYDLAFALCVFGSGAFLDASAVQDRVCTHNPTMLYVVKPLLSALPLWLRLHQNLRRFFETRVRHPHLSNAFKYAFAHSIVLFGAFNPDLVSFLSSFFSLLSCLIHSNLIIINK